MELLPQLRSENRQNRRNIYGQTGGTDKDMKCKIKWKETPCEDRWCKSCPNVWTNCNKYSKYCQRADKGYEGEIKEYDIWNEGTELWVDIKINTHRSIHLIADTSGRDISDGCPIGYDVIECLEIDGENLL